MTRDELKAFLAPLPDEAILGLTIYGEARGEPIEGQIAVGCVIRNRVLDRRWPNDYRGVCLQRLQFSCWNPSDSDPNFKALIAAATLLRDGAKVSDRLEQCAWVALGIARGAILDNTKGANHYHVANMQPRPSWAQSWAPVAQIKNHVFYNAKAA